MNIKVTAKFPKHQVEDLVKLAYGFVFDNKSIKPTQDYRVWVKNSKHSYAGRIFFGQNKMVVRVGDPSQFPRKVKYPRLITAPEYQFLDWQEAIFGVAVHEFWHWYQYNSKSPRSEIECEQRVVQSLDKWRSEWKAELEVKWKSYEEKQINKTIRAQIKAVAKESPEYELDNIAKKIAVFNRRLKLYQTKLKKLLRRQRFLQKKISQTAPVEQG